MAAHHAMWQSKLGAAFSLGSIVVAGRDAGDDTGMSRDLRALVPKLYRYLFDPNVKIKDAMKELWKQVVGDDAHSVVTDEFDAIMEGCLTGEIGCKLLTRTL
jgi:proteasome component ECM29